MNVFNKVTLQSLKKNKTRTIVTIIGIILSAAMICAVTTFASSIYDYALRVAIWGDGSWHGSEVNTSYETYQKIEDANEVKDTVYLQQLGYAYAKDCANEYKPYIYVVGASEGVDEMLPIHITQGEYPNSSDEILIPNHLATNGGIRYKLGDTISLELGDRMLDGYKMNQNNPAYVYKNGNEVLNDESIEVRENRTFTVVGFYDRLTYRIEPNSAPGYTAITVADTSALSEYSYEVYFRMDNAKDVFDFMDEYDLSGDRNTDVLMYQGATQYDSFSVMVISLASIVIALIMFGSIALIYNAFSISVSERTKQFGLLSSLGATKKQLRKMVLFEALTVAEIGIPVGGIAGIAGIGVTLAVIGNKFSSLLGYSDISMRLCVSWEAVIIAVVVALVTVLLSAWIPSTRATRVSAVEAIRQSRDIKLENKPVKTSKLTYKLFGLPGVLASKHYKRNKKKYRTTVVSLFMSIVLFVSASSFTDYMMETVGGGLATSGFDLMYDSSASEMKGKTSEEVLEIFTSEETIGKATYTSELYTLGIIDHKYLSQYAVDTLMDSSANAPAGYEDVLDKYSSISAYVYFLPDAEYKSLLKENGLSEAEFYNVSDPVGISIDGKTAFDAEKQKYTTSEYLSSEDSEIICVQMIDKFFRDYTYQGEHTDADGNIIVEMTHGDDYETIHEFPYDEVFSSYTLKTGQTITDIPYYIDVGSTSELRVIYPESFYNVVIPEGLRANDPSYRFYMTSSDHKASERNLQIALNENGLATEKLYNYAQGVEENRNMVTIIRVFAYGFIILISLIAAANVFNTISTNIALRRREFAMLKSVGMTEKGFNKMMNFECVLYGSRALLLGVPVSCGITYLIFLAIMKGYETAFHLPWTAIGIAVLSVFLVVFATMMYSMSKIKKDNPIDALKNENL